MHDASLVQIGVPLFLVEPVLLCNDLIAFRLSYAFLGKVLASDVVRLQVLLLPHVGEIKQLAVD